jgi:hypothetical protein
MPTPDDVPDHLKPASDFINTAQDGIDKIPSLRGCDDSTQAGRLTVGGPEKETAEKKDEQAIVYPGLLQTLEPGAPRIVLGILLLAALCVLFFAFSSCF